MIRTPFRRVEPVSAVERCTKATASPFLAGCRLTFVMVCLLSGMTNAQDLRACVSSGGGNYGKFAASPKVELLPGRRQVKLIESLTYLDPCGAMWVSPKDSIVDGASIPRLAWSIIGAPLDGTYRDASIIHDVACDTKTRPWQVVHDAFYFAMLASGVEAWRAKVMYAAVYHFGPRWRDPQTHKDPPKRTLKDKAFKELAEVIRVRETSPGAFNRPAMSLEDIESWVPSR